MRVLDLSCDVAGRFGARLFADAGDEVFRRGETNEPHDPFAAYVDRGKRAVAPGELAALARRCDLVWTSFDRGHYLGHAAGLEIPESCVHVTTSSFGTAGPYAAWRGGSMADWAASGYLYITGDPNREPLSGPENVCAYAAGYTAAAGAEAALIDRLRTGRGRHLDISTMEAMLLLHQSTFARTNAGELRRRTGRYTEVYPLTVLPCRDGHVSIGVVSDHEFDKLAVAIGRPELAADPRFADGNLRWDNRDALDRELAIYLDAHDAQEVVETLQTGGLACSAVASALGIARNPQLAARDYWIEAPGGGQMPGDPLRHFHPFAAGGGDRLRLGEPGRLPLEGVTVLDFTIFWAGPSATRTLADLGANVIWLERPGARLDCHVEPGERADPWKLHVHLHDSKMFRGKRSITLDLAKEEDRAVAHAIAREAHIVVENFRPGVADRLGVGPRDLARINPLLTYVSLSGWGASGPWRDWRSYGPTIEAASSMQGRTGYHGGEPLRLGHTLPDATGGLVGALAALRGLRRSLSGEGGGWFDVAQLEAYVTLGGEGLVEATRYGREPELCGNRSRTGALQGVFRCKGEDRWIALRLETARDCAIFAGVSGLRISLSDDPDRAEAAIAAWTCGQDMHVLADHLQREGLEAFPALDALDLLADPHLDVRGYFRQVVGGERSYAMQGTPLVALPAIAEATGAAPRPGQHSAEIRAQFQPNEASTA